MTKDIQADGGQAAGRDIKNQSPQATNSNVITLNIGRGTESQLLSGETITWQQAEEIRDLVRQIANVSELPQVRVYRRFSAHFDGRLYKMLPKEWYREAIKWLEDWLKEEHRVAAVEVAAVCVPDIDEPIVHESKQSSSAPGVEYLERELQRAREEHRGLNSRLEAATAKKEELQRQAEQARHQCSHWESQANVHVARAARWRRWSAYLGMTALFSATVASIYGGTLAAAPEHPVCDQGGQIYSLGTVQEAPNGRYVCAQLGEKNGGWIFVPKLVPQPTTKKTRKPKEKFEDE